MNRVSDKALVRELVNTLAKKGLRHVVASPGSRHAPLVISFNRHPDVHCTSIPDERAAAFFALGIAQYLNTPVALVCTSGTAGLNYAPALAEAYYQMLPLIAITSDRPVEYTDQADGQTIDQKNIFSNYVKASFQFPQEAHHEDNIWHANRIANEVYNKSIYPQFGPVHINIPLREPLYGLKSSVGESRTIELVRNAEHLDKTTVNGLKEELADFQKIMILNGQLKPKAPLDGLIQEASLRSNIVVLAESLSNFSGERVIPCIDRTLLSISEQDLERYRPELLITFDGPVISKKIKAYLRRYRPKEHWHIGNHRSDLDTYQSLTKSIMCSRTFFVKEVLNAAKETNSTFSELWYSQYLEAKENHSRFLEKAPYSDLPVFQSIVRNIPEYVHLQLGNSSVVRYVQLFDEYPKVPQYGNRGTSGIDGCTSTAAGYAYASGEETLLITGDLSFFYDTNGLWHKHLSPKLRIILINNGGGGIFKIIEGPDTVDELEDFFVAGQQVDTRRISEAYGLQYHKAENRAELEAVLNGSFFELSNTPRLLEVVTPPDSHKVLKSYFEALP